MKPAPKKKLYCVTVTVSIDVEADSEEEAQEIIVGGLEYQNFYVESSDVFLEGEEGKQK